MGNGGKGLINKPCRTGVVVAKIFAVSRPVAEFSNVLRGPSCSRTAEGMDQISIKTPSSKCHLYWCLIEFIETRYSQLSCW
jgi:hypothetical protein